MCVCSKELSITEFPFFRLQMNFDDFHHVRHRRLARRSIDLHIHDEEEPWHVIIQQEVKRRTKRDYGITLEGNSFRAQAESEEELSRQIRAAFRHDRSR